jgi:hypothetical protein
MSPVPCLDARRAAVLAVASMLLAGCGFAGDSDPKRVGVDPLPPVAAPRAACGPGSVEETGLQGQVTLAERQSGRSLEPFSCNMELVGQYRHGEGASWQFAWYEDCGYYGTLDNDDRQTLPGAVVVQAKNPARPVGTALLTTPAVNDPHESLKVNEKRALLGAVDLGGPWFDVYDVGADCAHPRLLASVEVSRNGHEGEWAPDGLTYWGSDITGGNAGTYYAIDTTDPRNPAMIAQYAPGAGGIHGLSITDDGSRGYFTTLEPAGFVIADTTAVQARVPGATVREISRIQWADGALAQNTIPVTIKGRPYIIQVDEGGHGAARIIDISNELVPIVVSKLKLEVHLPENCAAVHPEGGCGSIFVYDGHYCSVDRKIEPTVVGCGYFESGIRIFDIRDPENPKEIAYYNPGGLNQVLPGSSHSRTAATPTDRCAAQVRFIPERAELWTHCQDNEFLVLRFTNGAWPFPG